MGKTIPAPGISKLNGVHSQFEAGLAGLNRTFHGPMSGLATHTTSNKADFNTRTDIGAVVDISAGSTMELTRRNKGVSTRSWDALTKSVYPRVLAVHEAGHAVAAIVQGGWVDAVHLRTRAECLAGDVIETDRGARITALGAVESMIFSDFPGRLIDHYMDKGLPPLRRDLAIKDMVVLFAGPYADIRQRRQAPFWAMHLPGARGDNDLILAIGNLLPDGKAAIDEAARIASRLVKDYWPYILAVADAIHMNRYTPGEVIESIVPRVVNIPAR